LELIRSILQLLQLFWGEILDGDVHDVTDVGHLDFRLLVPPGVPKIVLT
jgi:hypothetical protein